MEEMREVALAYYHSLSIEQKAKAQSTFKEMDVNGDGTISLTELTKYLGDEFAQAAAIFRQLDCDGNCALDYDEFVTLYYMIMSDRFTHCGSCGTYLPGVYFTCVQCFHRADTTYDLCCSCLGSKKYAGHHEDAIFCDIHTLLLSKSRRTAQVCAAELEGTLVGEISKIGVQLTEVEAKERETRLSERIQALESKSIRLQTEAEKATKAHKDLKKKVKQRDRRRMILDIATVTVTAAGCSIM